MIREPLLEELVVYLRLARYCKDRLQMPQADRLLTIAGCCAWQLGLRSFARLCRQQVISRNPGHMAARFDDLGVAMRDDDFLAFLGNLVKKIPPDTALDMLHHAGCDFHPKREDFNSDLDYASAAFGVSPVWIEACFGES